MGHIFEWLEPGEKIEWSYSISGIKLRMILKRQWGI